MFNQEMAEGSEDDGFWGALGGQADYQKARDLDKPLLYPRLFHCTISPAGCLRVNEVSNFGQEVSALGKICYFFFCIIIMVINSIISHDCHCCHYNHYTLCFH